MQDCNRAATRMLEASNSELDPAKRAGLFQKADALGAVALEVVASGAHD
jgi:hypothetical protein